jgi:stage IV sporulation protein FB
MRDPISWSLPLGRFYGINVRVHLFFPFLILGLILRAAFHKTDFPIPGQWIDMTMLLTLLFGSVLLHEFGHCAGARLMDGDAHEVLLWPLGGLAYVDVPHTPRANFVTTFAGPLVNIVLCLVSALLLLALSETGLRPPLDPFAAPFRAQEGGAIILYTWQGVEQQVGNVGLIVLARVFWVNWTLTLLNLVLVGYPMDAGRLLQCLLWPRYGYRQSMMISIVAGFVTAIILGVIAIVRNEWLLAGLAIFIFLTCWQMRVMLETGAEESLFGYDFSQGYTSLEREQAPPKPRLNWWQRWQQRRAIKRMQREQELREAEERRMDELLQKVQQTGLPSLTDEERRFLKRVSDRYRNRH